MEGNDIGECSDDFSSSSIEMDVYETSLQENDGILSHLVAGKLAFPLFVVHLLL